MAKYLKKDKVRELDVLRKNLTLKQIEAASKNNPFRIERNRSIRDLHLRGVKLPLLAALSGLSRSTVHRIGQGKTKAL